MRLVGERELPWLTPCPCVSLMDVTHGNAFSLVLVWCVPRYSSSGLCQAADGTSAADVVSAGCCAMSNQKKAICCAWLCGLMRKRMAQLPFAKSNYCFSILASVISYKCWLELFCYGSPAALGKQVTMVCLLVALVLH